MRHILARYSKSTWLLAAGFSILAWAAPCAWGDDAPAGAPDAEPSRRRIETPMLGRVLDGAMPILGAASHEDAWRTFQQFLLIKRMGRPEDVAALVAYLASERASYITGSVYDVDGGFVKSI